MFMLHFWRVSLEFIIIVGLVFLCVLYLQTYLIFPKFLTMVEGKQDSILFRYLLNLLCLWLILSTEMETAFNHYSSDVGVLLNTT